ncbi:MAG: hypothetical protein ACR2O4_09145 [Hyphomicrobiaceae bacterium]
MAGLGVNVSGDAVVLRRLFENEDALQHGHKPPHRILLIGTGGGMCCTRAAGYLTAFREFGIENAVDHAVTVSGSGGAMGAYLSGMPHRASQMFEQLGASGFIETAKFKTPKLKLQYLADILRGQHSPLAFNDELIRAHRTTWHAVVTRLSGESLLVDTKDFQPDAAEAVLASSALPQVAEPILAKIGDAGEELLVDGACGMPLPVSAGVMKFRPSTVLVLESRPTPNSLPRMERLLWPTMTHFCLRHSPKILRQQTASMAQMIKLEGDRLERLKRIKWCRVSPDNSNVNLSPFTIDPFVLRRAAEEARAYMHDILAEAQPVRQV